MKNVFKTIAVLAASLLTFGACQGELEQPEQIEKSEATHSVTFVAGAPETKTAANVDVENGIVNYSWTEDDVNHSKFHVFENGNAAKSVTLSLVGGVMNISAEFYGEGRPADAKYTGYFNYGVQPIQAADGENYDQDSDVLIAKETSTYGENGAIPFQFKRLGAIAEVTLKGLSGAYLYRVTIESTDGTFLAGPLDEEKGELVGERESIMINCSNIAISNGEATLRFVSLPVPAPGARLRFIVETTDDCETVSHKYDKIFKQNAKIEFTQGNLTSFSVSCGDSELKTSYYARVTTVPTDWSGEYLIVDEFKDGTKTKGRCWTGVDAANCYSEADIENNEISTKPVDAVTVTISSVDDGYSIKINGGDKNGKYISGKSESNTIVYGDNAVANELTFDNNGLVTILSNSTSFRFNATSGQDRFRYFKTSTTGNVYHLPALYQMVEAPSSTDAVHVTSVSITETSLELEVGKNHTLVSNVLPDNATDKRLTWESDNESIATVENGIITALAVGEANITVTTLDGGFTASCTVSVKEVPIVSITAGKFYSWTLGSSSKFSDWNAAITVSQVSWTPAKVSVNGSPTVGNFDSARGHQFGAAKTNQIKEMSITGTGYATYCGSETAKGITKLTIDLCAKDGNTITPTAKVGGVVLTAKTASATISGSTAESVVTFEFTSDTPLDGDIVFNIAITSAGAVYVKAISINP